jgi:transposase
MWNGQALPDRSIARTEIHYRLYDRRTGRLLSFGSTNSIDALATDILRTQAEHPTAQIQAVQYDGPAY